jgi:peptide/nickel transport system substrate-binding protein
MEHATGRRLTRLGAAALAALMVSRNAGAAGAQTDVGTPRDQTLIVDMLDARVTNPTNMNPFQEGAALIQGLHQLALGQLWDIDTVSGKQFPDMAATMPEALDKSFTKFRFKTRTGLAWSDGVPFSAKDVVFTAKMILGHPGIPYSGVLKGLIKDIRAPDDNTVEIVLPHPGVLPRCRALPHLNVPLAS